MLDNMKDQLSETPLLAQMERELYTPKVDQQTRPLYHYTDAAGLMGILRERQLWATHFLHLNDQAELVAGERLLCEEASKLARECTELSNTLLTNISAIYQRGASLSQIADVYIASFTERDDDLPQWRAYGADGRGYCIGFSKLRLPTGDNPKAQVALALFRCEYDRDRFRENVRQELRDVATGFERYARTYGTTTESINDIYNKAINILLRRVAFLVPKFKNEAFHNESEWRLVAFPMRHHEAEVVRFRTRQNGTIVPYLPVSLCEEKELVRLERVRSGPRVGSQADSLAVRRFLEYSGYDSELLFTSQITYRGQQE